MEDSLPYFGKKIPSVHSIQKRRDGKIMDESLHYLIMANQMLVQRGILERLKETGLTIGQPKVLDYLKDHDGSNQKEIARACFLEAGSLTIILNKTPFSLKISPIASINI